MALPEFPTIPALATTLELVAQTRLLVLETREMLDALYFQNAAIERSLHLARLEREAFALRHSEH